MGASAEENSYPTRSKGFRGDPHEDRVRSSPWSAGRAKPPDEPQLQALVTGILTRVKREGDDALRSLAREFDEVDLRALEVPFELCENALIGLDPGLREDLGEAARNIDLFHGAQIPYEVQVIVRPGVTLGRRPIMLLSVGVYAPGRPCRRTSGPFHGQP